MTLDIESTILSIHNLVKFKMEVLNICCLISIYNPQSSLSVFSRKIGSSFLCMSL